MSDDTHPKVSPPSCLSQYRAWSRDCALCPYRMPCIAEQERQGAA